MRKKGIVLFVVLLMGVVAMAADLPTKGRTPPAASNLRGPGSHPDDPATPIGGGVFILLGMSITYFLVKRKKSQ